MLITFCLGIGGTVARVKRRRDRSIDVCSDVFSSLLWFVCAICRFSILHGIAIFTLKRGGWLGLLSSIRTIGVSVLQFLLSIMYGTGFVGLVRFCTLFIIYKGGCLLDTRTIDQDQDQAALAASLCCLMTRLASLP